MTNTTTPATATASESTIVPVEREEILAAAAKKKKGGAPIQRMTFTLKLDVLMEDFGKEFGVEGWSPTREVLQAYLQDVIETVDHERLARVVSTMRVS
jgi:hypothetical protein